MKLAKFYHMLFDLLKSSLNNCAADTEVFKDLQPPKQLKFKWAMSVEKYESRHRRYCEAVHDLQQLFREHGIIAVQMKGVGFSAVYNQPHQREGGDIDIFTYSADTAKMSHLEANSLADKLMKQMGNHVEMQTMRRYLYIRPRRY